MAKDPRLPRQEWVSPGTPGLQTRGNQPRGHPQLSAFLPASCSHSQPPWDTDTSLSPFYREAVPQSWGVNDRGVRRHKGPTGDSCHESKARLLSQAACTCPGGGPE